MVLDVTDAAMQMLVSTYDNVNDMMDVDGDFKDATGGYPVDPPLYEGNWGLWPLIMH